MTEKEIERLAELVAIKVSERYLVISKDVVKHAIQSHKFECRAGVFSRTMGVVCAVIGGCVVALFNWIIRK